jgi:hypothetical protein
MVVLLGALSRWGMLAWNYAANMQARPIRFRICAVSEELIRFQPIKE